MHGAMTTKRGKVMTGIAMAVIVLAALIAMAPTANAGVGVGVGANGGIFKGLKGISYILLGLSFLSAILALGYFIIKMIRKAGRRRFRSKEEEIIETIKEVKELRKKLES